MPRVRALCFASTTIDSRNTLTATRRRSPAFRVWQMPHEIVFRGFNPSPEERSSARAGMGALVNGEQLLCVYVGVGLRGGERGVAEQLLHGAEVSAIGEEMRGKGMAQRMGRGAFGETQCAAQPLHQGLG